MPLAFSLHPNAPNPFTGSTRIVWEQPHAIPVRLAIYDVMGRHVRDLVGGRTFPAGRHEVTWDGKDGSGNHVSAGIYFSRITAGEWYGARRIMRLR